MLCCLVCEFVRSSDGLVEDVDGLDDRTPLDFVLNVDFTDAASDFSMPSMPLLPGSPTDDERGLSVLSFEPGILERMFFRNDFSRASMGATAGNEVSTGSLEPGPLLLLDDLEGWLPMSGSGLCYS